MCLIYLVGFVHVGALVFIGIRIQFLKFGSYVELDTDGILPFGILFVSLRLK